MTWQGGQFLQNWPIRIRIPVLAAQAGVEATQNAQFLNNG